METKLKPVAKKTTLLAGIRNGITSAQGFYTAIEIGVDLYAVDTGARQLIFHPKVFFARTSTSSRIIIGSANLTFGGLHSNIEASVSFDLDLKDTHQKKFSDDIETQLFGLIEKFPKNVTKICNKADVIQLLSAGRLSDESVVNAPNSSGSSIVKKVDDTPRMKLKNRPKVISSTRVLKAKKDLSSEQTSDIEPGIFPKSNQEILVWESKPLTRRDLTIPTGTNTNPTGSMLLKKGNLSNIDQRHYFRDIVFQGLNWKFDTRPSSAHIERAEAQFRLIAKNVDFGVFSLKLSYNSRKDTAAYRQKNSMTQIHWGDARSIVADQNLLGRTLRIYSNDTDHELFVIEID